MCIEHSDSVIPSIGDCPFGRQTSLLELSSWVASKTAP